MPGEAGVCGDRSGICVGIDGMALESLCIRFVHWLLTCKQLFVVGFRLRGSRGGFSSRGYRTGVSFGSLS